MEKPHEKNMYLKQKLFRGFEYCKIHAFQCYCYLNLYHVVPIDPWRTAVNKRGKIYSLYF